jgi:hypothetical protein
MAKQRDYKAEYRARNERARLANSRGYSGLRRDRHVAKVRSSDRYYVDLFGGSIYDTPRLAELYTNAFYDLRVGRKMTRKQKADREEFFASIPKRWFDSMIFAQEYQFRAFAASHYEAVTERMRAYGLNPKTKALRDRVTQDMFNDEQMRNMMARAPRTQDTSKFGFDDEDDDE